MRLFQVGLNNCADEALFRLFTAGGVKALHGQGLYWQRSGHPAVTGRNPQLVIHRNIRAGRPALETLEDFNAFFDMEFAQNGWVIENFRYFEILAQDYPDAKFILNTREKQDWLRDRTIWRDGLYLQEAMDRTGLSRRGVLNMWADDYHRHHDMVRAYFAGQKHRLLEFDIDQTPVKQLKRFVAPEMQIWPRHWHPAPRTAGWSLSNKIRAA